MIDLKILPTNPGCYLYKDEKNIIIYVGKAKNIRKRVSQYFQKTITDEKTKQLVERIRSVDYIITNSEVEALILENSLIKKHYPKYNIDLKDAKQYAYLEVTNETYPRIRTIRDKSLAKGTIIGPFVSGGDREEIRRFLIKTFKIRTCNKLPKRSCLRYHLNLCSAPCIQKISKENYDKNVEEATLVLKGKTKEAIKKIEEKMFKLAKEEAYEQALQCKEQVHALQRLEEKQHMSRTKDADEDIINFVEKENTIYLIKFAVRKGMLEEKKTFTFEKTIDWYDSFIANYYEEESVPKELILPKKIASVTKEFLEQKRGKKLVVTIPQQGTKQVLLRLAKKNLEHEFLRGEERTLQLQESLQLENPPRVLECFDISHLSGTNIVASMVQFKNGEPNKKEYRRFKMKTVFDNDDFASMHEVVKRRYKRLQEEKKPFPDLIIIDGGKGQLGAALEALEKLNINLPIISLAKKEEEIYIPKRSSPLQLPKSHKASLLLQAIRDEAHRFAITYNKTLRKKSLTT